MSSGVNMTPGMPQKVDAQVPCRRRCQVCRRRRWQQGTTRSLDGSDAYVITTLFGHFRLERPQERRRKLVLSPSTSTNVPFVSRTSSKASSSPSSGRVERASSSTNQRGHFTSEITKTFHIFGSCRADDDKMFFLGLSAYSQLGIVGDDTDHGPCTT